MLQRVPLLLISCLLAVLPPVFAQAEDAPAATGILRIVTLPGEAALFVDGARKGTSPASTDGSFQIRLPEGEHQIRAVKDSFDTVERDVFVGADTEQTLHISLAPEIEMVALPGGCFMMGSPKTEPERDPDEGPRHEVCLDPFEIGKYEVTFADWDACVADGGCPPIDDDEGWGRGRHPAINVSWQQAHDYIRWLNHSGGSGFRLPSEAEWEYAARAGTDTAFSTGPCINTDQANFDGTFEYGDCPNPTNVDLHRTQPVGSYPANPWGLYDVHGNVNEFVADCWNEGYEGAPTDGSAWDDGNCTRRVLRGGSWQGYPGYLRSAYRCRSGPAFGHRTIGFRLARTPDEAQPSTAAGGPER
jgi:formylglycine-generating enzyme required for sulfatase activity